MSTIKGYRRIQKSKRLSGTERLYYPDNGPFYSEVTPTQYWADGYQYTLSENHSEWFDENRNRLADIGGNFYTEKLHASIPNSDVELFPVNYGDFWWRKITGTAVPGIDYSVPLSAHFPGEIALSESELNQKGATAIKRSMPTKPAADAGTAAGEAVKDGVPNLPILHSLAKRAKIAKDAGDEFLNVAFGWLPLVDDVRNTAKAVIEFDRLMKQYEAGSGKPHRRQYDFPFEESDELVYRSDPVYAASISGKGLTGSNHDTYERGRIVVRRKTSRQCWFHGSYTYYLPSGYDSRSATSKNVAAAKKILGLELTPELLWNLAPWSWAIDWFSNAGDVISNVGNFANQDLVLHYGYLMSTTKTTVTISHEGPSGILGVGAVRPLVFTREVKQRAKANPYGFGVSMGGLSTFQLAILSALGLSKS